MTDATPTQIVFLLFPGITQLDFTAPAQALSRMPGARLAGAAATREAIGTDSGFAIVPTHDFAACPPADLLYVPGGPGVANALGEPHTIESIGRTSCRGRGVPPVEITGVAVHSKKKTIK